MKKKIDDAGLSAPDTKAGRLQRACLVLLRQHERDGAIPTNGRFLFYELEQQGVIPKAYLDASGRKRARQPAQDISDATMRLRELGLVPWWWIVDETREVTTWRVAASVYEYIMDSVEDARIDCWGGKLAPLILCEARATKGVVERITGDYLCPIAATGGQSGGFIVNEIVPLLAGNERMVLYIGDCEVDGPADQIEAATRRRIEQHTGRTFTAEGRGSRSRASKSDATRACGGSQSTRSTAATSRPAPTRRSSARRLDKWCWSGCCATGSTRCCPSRWTMYLYGSNASAPRSVLRSPSSSDEAPPLRVSQSNLPTLAEALPARRHGEDAA